MQFSCVIGFDAFYAILLFVAQSTLSWFTHFCVEKIEPKIAYVEKKLQISGMLLSTEILNWKVNGDDDGGVDEDDDVKDEEEEDGSGRVVSIRGVAGATSARHSIWSWGSTRPA